MNPRVPQEQFPFYHSIPAQLRFNDIDVVGHLNNSVYFSLLDLGKMQYFNAVMGGNVTWRQVPVVIVNINANFYSPTYMDEEIEIKTQALRMSERSLALEQRVTNPRTGDVKCVAVTVMAGFDAATASGAPIPSDWAEAICRFEKRKV